MQEVNIYIDAIHTGHFKRGKGIYTLVLEYIRDGIPYTKEYIEGLTNTTKNRTAILACIDALNHLIRECKVNLFINSNHVVRAVVNDYWIKWLSEGLNAKGDPVKNLDLWQQLYDSSTKHDITYAYTETNSYTSYMRTIINKTDINYKEDFGNV